MDFLLALLMYLGLIPSPQTLDRAPSPGLTVEPTADDGSGTVDDTARPRTCGKNCTF